MTALDVPVFSMGQAQHLLALAGLDPTDLSEANLERIGLASTKTQRERVLAAYEVSSDVDVMFEMLGGTIPKSSIRAYLSQSVPHGDWRSRRRRRDAGGDIA